MEARFYLLICDLDPALRNEVVINLGVEKAVFVDEVIADWQELYLALEYVELPSSIILLDPDKMILGWEANFGQEELYSLAQPFMDAGLRIALMLLILEDGSSMQVLSFDSEAWEDYSALFPLSVSLLSESSVAEWLRGTLVNSE